MDTTPTRGQQRREPDVKHPRRLPVGADVLPQGGVHFRVWASKRHCVEVVLEGGPGHRSGASPVAVGLAPEGTGYFPGLVADVAAGTLYRYRLNGEAALYADPASRFQPDGPHGPSQVIDPSVFPWHDQQQPYVLRGRAMAVLRATRPRDEARSPHAGRTAKPAEAKPPQPV